MDLFPAFPDMAIRNFHDDADYLLMRDLWLACRDSRGLKGSITIEDLKNQTQWMQHFEITKQLFLIFHQDDLIGTCSYNWSEMGENVVVFHMEGMLLPRYWESDLPDVMLKTMEHLSQLEAARLPDDTNVFYSAWLPQKAASILDFYLTHGYQKTRYFIEMVRSTDIPLADHSLPTEIEIRPVKEDQMRMIFEAENEATRDHWGHVEYSEEQYIAWQEDRRCQPALWKVAWSGNEVCGMVRNYIDSLENETEHRLRGYTEFISVRRPWRRKGLAKALITESIRMFRDMGMQETALGVDTENPSSALALYQTLGYTENDENTYLVVTKPMARTPEEIPQT